MGMVFKVGYYLVFLHVILQVTSVRCEFITRLSNRSLLEKANIAFISNASSPCMCRIQCMVQPNCTAVTVHNITANSRDNKPFKCHLTNEKDLVYKNVTNFTKPSNGSHTYIKRFACASPFSVVQGVGCIAIYNTTKKSYCDAKKSCPAGSQLYTHYTDESFRTLARYTAKFVEDRDGFWIGLEGMVTDGGVEYRWLHGKKQSLEEQSDEHSNLWNPGEPNQQTFCIRLQHVEKRVGLADRNCDVEFAFICEIKQRENLDNHREADEHVDHSQQRMTNCQPKGPCG